MEHTIFEAAVLFQIVAMSILEGFEWVNETNQNALSSKEWILLANMLNVFPIT